MASGQCQVLSRSKWPFFHAVQCLQAQVCISLISNLPPSKSSTGVKGNDTVVFMIKSFRHTGLEKFFKTGSKAGIQPNHAKRLRLQLATLNEAQSPSDMDLAGWWFHELGKDLAGHYAVTVSRIWRLTFAWDGTDAVLLDYQDYHD